LKSLSQKLAVEFDVKNAAPASCVENKCRMPLTIFAEIAAPENGSIETAKRFVLQC
jgi:hypothetical protein